MKHTIVALVENRPGVLNRVSSLFRRRNFNIASLTVGETEDETLSRMTIVVDANPAHATLVERSLAKIVNVVEVRDVTSRPSVIRELALIKVNADSQTRSEIMQIADIFRAKIVDVARDSLIVEVTGPEDKVDAVIRLLQPFGIKEMVRTGRTIMERGEGGLGDDETDNRIVLGNDNPAARRRSPTPYGPGAARTTATGNATNGKGVHSEREGV